MRDIRFPRTLAQLSASMIAVVLATVTLSALASEAEAPVDLRGSWTLNAELSDDPQERLEERLKDRDSDRRRGKGLRARRAKKKMQQAGDKLAAARQSLEGYFKLVIHQEDPVTTITNARHVAQVIYTDGRSADGLDENEVVGTWHDGQLSVHRQQERGSGEQTYELEDGRLIVVTTISGQRGRSLELRHVYDREE